jgi:hypothetical protein
MIKSLTFIEDYELSLEKESQKRWGVKTYKPTAYSREKKPWKMFFYSGRDCILTSMQV